MSKMEAEEFFTLGMESLKSGDTSAALDYLEKAVSLERSPLYCSNLAIILAKEKRDFKRAVSLCNEAIRNEPKNSLHFLNLGRIHLLGNQKKDAIRIFNMGLRYGEDRDIMAELKRFDRRRSPTIPFLERGNLVNRFLGKLTFRLGFR